MLLTGTEHGAEGLVLPTGCQEEKAPNQTLHDTEPEPQAPVTMLSLDPAQTAELF